MYTICKIRKDGVKQRFHISPLRSKIKRLYNQGLSSRDVGKKLNISHTRVLQLLKKENIKTRSVIKPILNPDYKELSPERAYIFGVMCGDGCIFSGTEHKGKWDYQSYIVYLAARDKDFINEFSRCIKSVYGVIPSLYFRDRNKFNKKWSSIWTARIKRKKVYEDLSSYKFGTKTWRVPNEVLNSNDKKVIGSFLRGFYDSEGSISIGPRSFTLMSHSTNYPGLYNIRNLLERLDIRTSNIMKDQRPNRRVVFYIMITGKKNLEIFLNKVDFAIQRKHNKLKNYLEKFRMVEMPKALKVPTHLGLIF